MTETTEADWREAWLILSGKLNAIIQNHMLGLASMGQTLTDNDLALGNTREMQDGFENCMHMVTADYIEPLIKAHNAMAEAVMTNLKSKATNATGLVRGTPEWRHEVLRIAAECDRIGIPAAAAQLRMIEFTTPEAMGDDR